MPVAYRSLERESAPPHRLVVVYRDATTDNVVTNTTGYKILDQGSGGIGTPTTPTTPTAPTAPTGPSAPNSPSSPQSGDNQHPLSNKENDFDWAEWHRTHSQGSGNILRDAKNTFAEVKTNIDRIKQPFKDFVDGIKEQIIPGSSGRVGKDGLTTIPPLDGSKAKPNPNAKDPLEDDKKIDTGKLKSSPVKSEDLAPAKKRPDKQEDTGRPNNLKKKSIPQSQIERNKPVMSKPGQSQIERNKPVEKANSDGKTKVPQSQIERNKSKAETKPGQSSIERNPPKKKAENPPVAGDRAKEFEKFNPDIPQSQIEKTSTPKSTATKLKGPIPNKKEPNPIAMGFPGSKKRIEEASRSDNVEKALPLIPQSQIEKTSNTRKGDVPQSTIERNAPPKEPPPQSQIERNKSPYVSPVMSRPESPVGVGSLPASNKQTASTARKNTGVMADPSGSSYSVEQPVPSSIVPEKITNPTRNTSDPAVAHTAGRGISFDPASIGIRDKPVEQSTRDIVAAATKAVDPQATVNINSGGQIPKDKGGVAGVTRTKADTKNHDIHDSGSAYAMDGQWTDGNGNRITPASDPEFFKELAKNATIAGATQIGMGGNIVHIGADPSDDHLRTWGYDANGNQTSAPDWMTQGIKEGNEVLKSDPDARAKLMGGIAPNPVPTEYAKTARGNLDRYQETARNLGFEEVARNVSNVQNVAGNAVNSIGAGVGAIGQGVGQLMNEKGMVDPVHELTQIGQGKNTLFGGAVKDQVNQAIGQAAGQAAGSIQTGIYQVGNALRDIDPAQVAKDGISQVAGLAGNIFGGGQQPTKVAAATTQPMNSQQHAAFRDTGGLMNKPTLDPATRDTIIKTVLGESVGESPEGQAAVASVIKNRAESGLSLYPNDPGKVATQNFDSSQPFHQFSAWNDLNGDGQPDNGQVNRYAPGDPEYDRVAALVDGVFNGQIPDSTNGALMYHTPDVNPAWNQTLGPPTQIGNHLFYPNRPASIMSRPQPEATTPTGSSITPTQRNAIADTGGVMSRPTSTATTTPRANIQSSNSTQSNVPTPSRTNTQPTQTTPTGGTVTRSQADAIRDTSVKTTTSAPKSNVQEKPTTSRANTQTKDSSYSGAMSSPTTTKPSVSSPTPKSTSNTQSTAPRTTNTQSSTPKQSSTSSKPSTVSGKAGGMTI